MSSPERRWPAEVIRASAGSGKTFQLTVRFLRLLLEGVTPDEILATTFTRKAAGEILGRVLSKLAQAAHDEGSSQRVGQEMDLAGLTHARATELLEATVRALHRLRVATLDAFFLQLAGSFALELGLPQAWHIAEVDRVAQLRRQAVRDLFRQQPERVRSLVPLLAKGVASRSIAKMIQEQVDELYAHYLVTDVEAWSLIPKPNRVSAEEIERSLERLESWPDSGNKTVDKGRKGDLFNFRQEEWEAFLKNGIAAKVGAGEEKYAKIVIEPGLRACYEPLVRHASAILLSQLAQRTEATYALLQAFDEHYAPLAREQGVLGFDDVTRMLATSEVIALGPEVAWRLDGRIEHLLLDEFQDTSPLQWNVLEPFSRQVTMQRQRSSFFCVGDVKQAIYGWRGGVAEIFDALVNELEDLTVSSLAKSRRSAPAIIETVNRVFGSLASNAALEAQVEARARWAERFESHSTVKDDSPGYCRVELAPPAEEGEKQEAKTFELAADRIAEFAQAAPEYTVGVLVRKNANIVPLMHLLQRRGIRASEEGGNPLTDSPAVTAVMSALALAEHPGNSVAAHHVARSPLGRVLGLNAGNDRGAVHRVASRLRQELMERGYGPALYDWIAPVKEDCTSREWRRLEQLVEVAYRCPLSQYPRPADFIERIRNQRVEDPSAAQVRVMTIHQAKGLEFDMVMLPDLAGKLLGQAPAVVTRRAGPAGRITAVCRYANKVIYRHLPQTLQQIQDDYWRGQACEALCLLYVAMTRAIYELQVVLPPKGSSSSAAGLIRAALGGQVTASDGALFETGDRDWLVKHRPQRLEQLAKTAERTPRMAAADAAELTSVERIPRATCATLTLKSDSKRRRMLPRVSPSSLEGGSQVQLARLLQREPSAAMVRGSLFHAWFQTIVWLEDAYDADWETRQTELRTRARVLRAPEGELTGWLEEFRAMLRRPALREALGLEGYRQRWAQVKAVAPRFSVWRERPFAVSDPQGLLTGTFDRVVVFSDGATPLMAEVLDYKTDHVGDPQARAARIEFYRPQIEAYQRAVGRLCNLPESKVSGRLLFVECGAVCPV